jgi:hypothetical protein
MRRHVSADGFEYLLVDYLREGPYPSGVLMDCVEASLVTQEQAGEYLDYLLERVAEEGSVGGELLDRIERLGAPTG